MKVIDPDSFSYKSTSTHLKIQIDTPDNYIKIIYFLKDIDTQFHTYHLQSDKYLRVVIRSTPIHPGNTYCLWIRRNRPHCENVTNVKHHLTKTTLPLFFVDIDPKGYDNNKFDISSFLNMKVKVKESYKRRQIPQCQNCQAYDHTRTYVTYQPKSIKYGGDHPTSPVKNHQTFRFLCEGPHPANKMRTTSYTIK